MWSNRLKKIVIISLVLSTLAFTLLLFFLSSGISITFLNKDKATPQSRIVETGSPLVRLDPPLNGADQVVIGTIIRVEKEKIVVEYGGEQKEVIVALPASFVFREKPSEAILKKAVLRSDLKEILFLLAPGDEVTISDLEFGGNNVYARKILIKKSLSE